MLIWEYLWEMPKDSKEMHLTNSYIAKDSGANDNIGCCYWIIIS